MDSHQSNYRQDTRQSVLHTLFKLAKAKDPLWSMMEEEFNKLNIGTSLTAEEKDHCMIYERNIEISLPIAPGNGKFSHRETQGMPHLVMCLGEE